MGTRFFRVALCDVSARPLFVRSRQKQVAEYEGGDTTTGSHVSVEEWELPQKVGIPERTPVDAHTMGRRGFELPEMSIPERAVAGYSSPTYGPR